MIVAIKSLFYNHVKHPNLFILQRIEEIRGLQDEIIRVQGMMQPLIHRHSKHFIKDDRYANPGTSSNVNSWVVYNAYR